MEAGIPIRRTMGVFPVNTPRPPPSPVLTQVLQLTRSIPGLTCALVGHKTPSHVAANTALQEQVAMLRPEEALALLNAVRKEPPVDK